MAENFDGINDSFLGPYREAMLASLFHRDRDREDGANGA